MEQSYKEKYEDILARLERAKNDNDVCDERFCCVIDDLIPELTESEDERIRKGLIKGFNECIKDAAKNYSPNMIKYWHGIEVDSILAWLEKQREKKPEENNGNIGGISTNWSVEDMSKVQRICKYLNEAKKYYADITEVRECIECLESLKGRVLPKQEWSEEDNLYYDDICEILMNLLHSERADINKTAVQEDLDWLGHIKEKTQRDEVIEKAVKWLSNLSLEDMEYKYDSFDTSEGWYRMIDDLKKQMEE